MNAAAQAAPAITIPEIGQPFGGGFFTGIYQQDGKRYAVITAPAAYEHEGEWGEYGEKIEGARSLTDSRANTEAMAAAGSELAKQVLALEIGGFTDWAIPARDVQELQYRHLKPTTQENCCWGRDGENPSSPGGRAVHRRVASSDRRRGLQGWWPRGIPAALVLVEHAALRRLRLHHDLRWWQPVPLRQGRRASRPARPQRAH